MNAGKKFSPHRSKYALILGNRCFQLCASNANFAKTAHKTYTNQTKQQQPTFIGYLFKRKPQQATIYDQIHFDNFFGGKCIK